MCLGHFHFPFRTGIIGVHSQDLMLFQIVVFHAANQNMTLRLNDVYSGGQVRPTFVRDRQATEPIALTQARVHVIGVNLDDELLLLPGILGNQNTHGSKVVRMSHL